MVGAEVGTEVAAAVGLTTVGAEVAEVAGADVGVRVGGTRVAVGVAVGAVVGLAVAVGLGCGLGVGVGLAAAALVGKRPARATAAITQTVSARRARAARLAGGANFCWPGSVSRRRLGQGRS